MAITYKGNKDAEIYQNNGAGFALKQVLVGTINSHDISMTEDARYLYLNAIYNLLVLENMNGQFGIIQTISFTSGIVSLGSSSDGEYLIIGQPVGKVLIYKFGG